MKIRDLGNIFLLRNFQKIRLKNIEVYTSNFLQLP